MTFASWRSASAAALTDEPRNRLQRRLRLVAERRMAAGRQLQQLAGAAHAAPDARQLLHRAVLVVLALDGEHGAGDSRQVLLDVPLQELRVEPGVGPQVKRLRR